MTKLSRLPSTAFLMAPLLALGLALPAVAAGPAAVVTPSDSTAPHAAKKPMHRVSSVTEVAPAKPGVTVPAAGAPDKAIPGKVPGKEMPATAKIVTPQTATTVPASGSVAPKTN